MNSLTKYRYYYLKIFLLLIASTFVCSSAFAAKVVIKTNSSSENILHLTMEEDKGSHQTLASSYAECGPLTEFATVTQTFYARNGEKHMGKKISLIKTKTRLDPTISDRMGFTTMEITYDTNPQTEPFILDISDFSIDVAALCQPNGLPKPPDANTVLGYYRFINVFIKNDFKTPPKPN